MSSTFLGNLHLNCTTPEHSEEVFNTIEPYVFEWTGLCHPFLMCVCMLSRIESFTIVNASISSFNDFSSSPFKSFQFIYFCAS